MITPECLNAVVSEGPHQGKSVAFCLAGTQEGRRLLALDGYRLGKTITRECLNAVVSSDPFKGQSVRTKLQASPLGKESLEIYDAEHSTSPATTAGFFDPSAAKSRGTKRSRGAPQ